MKLNVICSFCKSRRTLYHEVPPKSNDFVSLSPSSASLLLIWIYRLLGVHKYKTLKLDVMGVESSGSGLKIIVRGYFASEFSLLLRHTDEPQKGRNSCLWLQSRYVLSSFGVLLMSCRVNFHVVRSALQYSACRITCIQL